jgi:hypothetical protein
MDANMGGQAPGRNENPLDDYATRASRELAGRTTDVNNSSVERVESGQVSLRDSFAQSVQSSATYMEDAAAGVVKTSSLEAKDVAIGVAMASTVHADSLHAGVVAVKQLEGDEIRTGVLLAVTVRGDVHSTVSPLAGFAIGAGFAATLLLMDRAIKMIGRRLSQT